MPEKPFAKENDPQPRIEIAIDSTGNIHLETKGTKGKQCDLLSGALEDGLGEVIRRVDKENYYC